MQINAESEGGKHEEKEEQMLFNMPVSYNTQPEDKFSNAKEGKSFVMTVFPKGRSCKDCCCKKGDPQIFFGKI